MTRAFNETDEKLWKITSAYVASQLFDRRYPSDVGPVDWRLFHERAGLQLAAYTRRKPKKKDKK